MTKIRDQIVSDVLSDGSRDSLDDQLEHDSTEEKLSPLVDLFESELPESSIIASKNDFRNDSIRNDSRGPSARPWFQLQDPMILQGVLVAGYQGIIPENNLLTFTDSQEFFPLFHFSGEDLDHNDQLQDYEETIDILPLQSVEETERDESQSFSGPIVHAASPEQIIRPMQVSLLSQNLNLKKY